MTSRVGQQLGNYHLTRLLGAGGFAEVYMGEHVHLGTQAAIKVLRTHLDAASAVDGFRKEARIVGQLVHPNIVRVLDFGVEHTIPFLVMDLASQGSLRETYEKDTQLPLETVIMQTKQIAAALQYAHDHQVVHRDVKPANILIGRQNELLVSDFGIAVIAQSSQHQTAQDMAGTISYMAPEQIQSHPRPASDQYSLATMVYEGLCGRRPFEGSFTEIAVKQVTVPPPPLHTLITISPEVEQVILKALAKDPSQRFTRVNDFAQALENAARSPIGVTDTTVLYPQPASAYTIRGSAQPMSLDVLTPAKSEQTMLTEMQTAPGTLTSSDSGSLDPHTSKVAAFFPNPSIFIAGFYVLLMSMLTLPDCLYYRVVYVYPNLQNQVNPFFPILLRDCNFVVRPVMMLLAGVVCGSWRGCVAIAICQIFYFSILLGHIQLDGAFICSLLAPLLIGWLYRHRATDNSLTIGARLLPGAVLLLTLFWPNIFSGVSQIAATPLILAILLAVALGAVALGWTAIATYVEYVIRVRTSRYLQQKKAA